MREIDELRPLTAGRLLELWRETREAALVMERYYDRRYHKHGRHTR